MNILQTLSSTRIPHDHMNHHLHYGIPWCSGSLYMYRVAQRPLWMDTKYKKTFLFLIEKWKKSRIIGGHFRRTKQWNHVISNM